MKGKPMSYLGKCISFLCLLMFALHATAAGPATQPATQPIAGKVRLVLPPVVYAVPGIESNLYYDNVVLVLNPADYAFDVVCEKGMQLEERWTFTPKPEDVGDHRLDLCVLDESNAVIARGSTIVRVTPVDAGGDRAVSMLLVGASLTQAGIYPQHLVDLDEKDEHLQLKLIGSRGPGNAPATGAVRFEGYNGWTAEAYVIFNGPLSRTGQFQPGKTGSPFVYGDGADARLDFARYCKEFNGGSPPDVISIQLVVNEIFTANDDTIEARVKNALDFLDKLIAEFRKFGPDTRIGVAMPLAPSRSQDGFRNYRGARHQTRWQYRRNLHRAWEALAEHYAGREAEKIFLIPVYLNFDTRNHYLTDTSPANARSDQQVNRVRDGVHPAPAGYKQIGDSIYCWMKAVMRG
jgi:lysophospholipase L1-like esterase